MTSKSFGLSKFTGSNLISDRQTIVMDLFLKKGANSDNSEASFEIKIVFTLFDVVNALQSFWGNQNDPYMGNGNI